MTYPARVSLRQVNRVFFVDEQQVVDVRALEKSYSPIPETGPEHPVALFDDPEEHFVLVSRQKKTHYGECYLPIISCIVFMVISADHCYSYNLEKC